MLRLRKVSMLVATGTLLAPVLFSPAAQAQAHPARQASPHTVTQLLQVDYETGTLNSGITGLTTTHATAPDAELVVRPGYQSSYADQHQVTLGDPGYVSDGAPRSESATDLLPQGQFRVGDVQRYEFSVLLKDWQPYQAGDSDSGDIIFQGKYADANVPAFYIMTKRNAVAFRSPHLNAQTTIVPDFRPFINMWMNFRVDASWTTDATGYFRVSAEVPGQSDYQLVADYENVPTWQPVNPADHGYLKWGLYRPSESLANGDVPTRIVQHDDIRIFQLS